MPSPCCELWKACAVPEKPVVMLAGRVERARLFTAVTAAPRLPFGGRLKEIVTDGSCPECAILLGPTPRSKSATSASGTSAPLVAVTYSLASEATSSWYFGRICISTQYSLVLV